MTALLIVITVTVLISASCSLFESVLYSTRLGTLESAKAKEQHGNSARQFIDLKNNISEPIAGILILNTIANTGGAAVAGIFAVDVLGVNWLPVFSIVFTFVILFFSEIYPKTIGAVHWRGLWPYIIYPLKTIRFALFPFIYITEKATKSVTGQQKGKTITEDEILALVHLGAHEGEISREESAMVKNIINLEDKQVQAIMTPRRMIFSLDVNLSVAKASSALQGVGFTRIPVFEGDREQIIGYFTIHDLHKSDVLNNADNDLRCILRPIKHVPATTNCLTLLTSFLKNRDHIAIVMDEFDGVDGLVSLEDLLETVLGKEIVDETDREVDLQEAAKRKKKTK